MKTTKYRLSESTWAAPRAYWTAPAPNETGLPDHRIVHGLAVRLPQAQRLRQLGVRASPFSYAKCGGMKVRDWPTAFTVHTWTGAKWQLVLAREDLSEPKGDHIRWFDLAGLKSAALLITARGCSVDKGWTTWNLAADGFVLEGDEPALDWPPDTTLAVGRIDLRGCPRGVHAQTLPGEVRYRTNCLEVGFRLGRPGFTYLAVDEEARHRTGLNLIYHHRLSQTSGWDKPPISSLGANLAQGLRLHPVGRAAQAGLLEFDADGETSVRGNVVEYDVTFPAVGQRYRLRWEVLPDRLLFTAQRHGDRPVRAWHSGAWHVCLTSKAAACTVLGQITRAGEVGLLRAPVLFHAPGHGTLRIETSGAPVLCRADSFRPTYTTSFEIKLGEEPQPLGDYVLTPGRHRAEIELALHRPKFPVRRGTPRPVARALDRCAVTALTYRADTGTLSNNGNSMHAVLCADGWSAAATRIGPLLPGLDANDLLRDSLDRHLTGAPSYASGHVTVKGDAHYMEDEYLHTGAAVLQAIAGYLRATGDAAWLRRHATRITGELQRMRARDVDDDGLIESKYRHGISGEHQWSTNWYDVISFGWKDAFSNATLYPALRLLAEDLPRLGQPALAAGLTGWADKLKANYLRTFLNPATGLIAGWKCANGKLHDHAFLFVAGAAVTGGLVEGRAARTIISKLWKELERQRLDYGLGLPGNLRAIPYADLAVPMRPGIIENHSPTHAQARHFLAAMYQVGLTREADRVLEQLCASLADGSAFSGTDQGTEWRRPDGAHSGYEGILCDQFGVLAVAIDRYGRPRR